MNKRIGGNWKVRLIEEIFNEEEEASICGMAICLNKQQDQMVWIGNLAQRV